MRQFLQAMSLLTRIPVRVAWEPDLKWGKLTGWFPAVGLAVGLALESVLGRLAPPARAGASALD